MKLAVNLSTEVNTEKLISDGFDEVVLATGIVPRTLDIKGFEHPKVKSYLNVLRDKEEVGHKVAIIGAGGIGFDIACYSSRRKIVNH